MDRLRGASAYIKHMRLGFQPLLAPLFVWGFWLAGGRLTAAAAAGFVSLHLFLYPGATAFNSAYDGDRGPVSGLFEPPPLPPRLLAFSIGLQLAGAGLAVAAGMSFFVLYLLLALIFAAYSHPVTRWKARPLPSLLAVGLGQGVLGFAAGWCAGSPALPPLADERVLLGAAVAAFTTLGLYPSTQIFQVEEDAARGDKTLAVLLGPARALRLGAMLLAIAGLGASWLLARLGDGAAATLVGAGYATLVVGHLMFARRVDRGGEANGALFRWATATRHCAAAGFLAFLALQMLWG